MTDLRIAHRSALVDLDGVNQHIRRGRTLAVADHPIVQDNPDLWRPLVIDYDTETEPEAAPTKPRARKAAKPATKPAEPAE